MRRSVLVLALIVPLAGCSLFGDGEEEAAPVETAGDTARARTEPVASIARREIGRTRDGFVLTAFGEAPGAGYGAPVLAPRREGRPGADGFVEYDFLARPPDPGFALGRGSQTVRRLRADRLIDAEALRGTRGLRVFSAGNASQIAF
ncbi:MAG: hypothetical protein ACFBWO_05450 [Paracoccaceae bacterium]